MIADITVFDPNRVLDRATHRDPVQPSAGIEYVLVAGTPVVDHGQFLRARFPGRAIKGHADRDVTARGHDMTAASREVTAAAEQRDPAKDSLQQVLDAAIHDPRSHYHGIVLRIQEGEDVWSLANGISDVRTRAKMAPDSRFRCGSVLKPFISTVILQLVESGQLHLDDHLTSLLPRRYWERFQYAADITLEMLLSHRSGIGNIHAVVYSQPGKIWKVGEFLDRAASFGPKFKPGESYSYNNTEYNLLGLIIEQVTGVSWRQNVRERILMPLALNDTSLPEPGDRRAPPRHARGYDLESGSELDVTEVDPSMAGAAGGQALISTTSDLTKFMRALLGGRLFKQQATLAMMMNFRNTDRPDSRYGLGLGEYHFPDGTVAYGHTGGTAGFASAIFHIPARDLSIALMINQSEGGPLPGLVMAALKAFDASRATSAPGHTPVH